MCGEFRKTRQEIRHFINCVFVPVFLVGEEYLYREWFLFRISKRTKYLCSVWFFIQSIFADRNNSFQQNFYAVLKIFHFWSIFVKLWGLANCQIAQILGKKFKAKLCFWVRNVILCFNYFHLAAFGFLSGTSDAKLVSIFVLHRGKLNQNVYFSKTRTKLLVSGQSLGSSDCLWTFVEQ